MARRRVKVTVGILGGVLAVLVLVAVLVPLLVPREKLRAMAETQLREQTGGEVSLGELSLRVLPRLRLVLGESSLAVTGEGLRAAGQQPGPLVAGSLELERLDVDLALWPLLRKQVEFRQVSLIAPRLEVTTTPPETTDTADETTGAPTEQVDPGVGLALAAVAVRDGELVWREEGTGRAVAVRGWRQDLEAPALGELLARLQRMGGMDVPVDAGLGDVALSLDTRVESIELTGFGEQPPPPLADLRLQGRLIVPPAADEARCHIEELSMPGWLVSARGRGDAERVVVEELTVAGGDALRLTGSATLADLAAAGPVQADLDGEVDLALLLDHLAPYLPPPPEDAAPLPELTGTVAVTVAVNLTQAPAVADAAGWQEGWRQGLDGTATLQARSGPITVSSEQLGEPLTVGEVTVTSDLHVADGRTEVAARAVAWPGIDADLELGLVLPPAAGPLQADLHGKVDLAELMPAVEPLMPPREPDAPPLPEIDGRLDARITVDLAAAPSLADTAAWRGAWQAGLDGRAELAVVGTRLVVSAPQLGEPLRAQRLEVAGDLSSPSGRSHLELLNVTHPILTGDVAMDLTPDSGDGAVDIALALPLLDLDAVAAMAQAAQAAADGHTRAGFSLVSTAWADEPAPQVGDLIPPDLAADLTATVAEMRFLQTPYTDVRVTGSLRERIIDVKRLTARLGSGRVAGNARLDYAADPGGRVQWDVRVTNAPASTLMKPYLTDFADLWTGTMSADARGSCDLADPEAIRRTLTIEGDLEGSDGIIDLRQSLAGVRQYLGDRQDLLRVKYSAARQHYEVREGKVMVTGLRIDGHDTDWTGDGWFGLDGTMDADLSVRLPAGYTPDLGDLSFVAEALRDDQGRIRLDFGLTGRTAAPTVNLKVDPGELMQSDAVQEKVEEEVKKGLGGLLDRLQGK